MWTELTPELIPLTKEQAEIHSQRPHIDGDRDRETTAGKNRIAWLEDEMKRGCFITPTWSIAEIDGQWYRVDGGHSSLMLANCNGSFPKHKSVLLRKFRCETKEDLADLFSIFDNRKSLRTIGDKIKAHKSVHEELADISPTITKTLVYGISVAIHGGTRKIDEDERVAMIHNNREYIAWGGRIFNKSLRAQGLWGCAYRTFGMDEQLATDFWTLVRDQTAPSPRCPTRVLADFVFRLYIPTERQKWDTRAVYVKAIHAWNAWMRGTTTDLKYQPEAGIPKMVCVKEGKLVSFG